MAYLSGFASSVFNLNFAIRRNRLQIKESFPTVNFLVFVPRSVTTFRNVQDDSVFAYGNLHFSGIVII